MYRQDDADFAVGLFAGGFFGLVFGIIIHIGWDSVYIKLNETEWKCSQAKILNDDPSKTECVVYRRKDKLEND